MKDTITEEDMLIHITKTEIEKRLNKTERENEILQEKYKILEDKIRKIQTLVNEADKNTMHLKRQIVYNANTKSSIFYQEKKPVILNKLKRGLGVEV